MVGIQGLEPHLPRPRRGALTLTRYPGGSGRNRTDSATLARRARCLSYSPPSRCGARYRTVPGCSWPIFRRTASVSRQDGACRRCSRYGHVKKQARTKGAQGPQELNPHSARVGAGPPSRWLIPIKGEPPGGNLLGRFPVTQSSVLPGNLRDAQGKRRARLAVPTVRFIRLLEHRHE